MSGLFLYYHLFNGLFNAYRLTESTSTAPTTSKTANVPKRHEPTNEAKIAGQAALARLEGMKINTPKLNT